MSKFYDDTSPFSAPFIRSGQRAGRGQYLQIVVATGGTPVTVKHTIGRVPQMLIVLDPGSNSYPAWSWTSKTSTQFSWTAPSAGTYLVWIN